LVVRKIETGMRNKLIEFSELWGSKVWKLDKRPITGNYHGKADYYIQLDGGNEIWLGTGFDGAKKGILYRLDDLKYFYRHKDENEEMLRGWIGDKAELFGIDLNKSGSKSENWTVVSVRINGEIFRYKDYGMHYLLVGHYWEDDPVVETVKKCFLAWIEVHKIGE